MRIAFDIAALGQGGMERQLLDVATGLSARGHQTLIVVNKRATAYTDEIRDAGLEVRELERERRSDRRVVRDLADVLRAFEADCVVGVNFNATAIARLAARRLGIPAVTAEHSTDRLRQAKVVLANRMLASRTSAVIACAEAQVPSLLREGNPSSRVVVVRNGVDTERFERNTSAAAALRAELGLPETAFAVGLVAAHRREKRHDRFFDAIGRLVDRGVDAYGLAVGGGPLLGRNRELAGSGTAAERLLVVGPRTDVPAVYSACDACVLCSDAVETLPLVMMEAQACETPVVAMQIGGVAETFEPGLSGILVGQGDIDGMTEALASLAAEPALARAMGASGRRWVAENRSIADMVDGYERVLRQAVESRTRQ